MAEIEGRLGHLHGCHVIQRAGSQPHPGMLAPAPARLRPPGSRSRPTHGRLPIRFPAGLAGIHYHDPTTGSVRSR